MYRVKLSSLQELPKDKQPPRNLWDKGFALDEYLETVWDDTGKSKRSSTYIDIDPEEVE